jgi:hypothetical protein
MVTLADYGHAVEYLNYTNNEYKVQFQYPSDSIVLDQTPPMIMVSPNSTEDVFLVIYVFDFNDPQWFGTSDLELATNRQFDSSRTGSEFTVLEYMSPWFTNIHGHKAGTYILTTKGSEADDDKEKILKTQEWLIHIGPHGYHLVYNAPADEFDSKQGIDSRAHFINSIKFLK